jgi:hypothetical protein
LNVLSSSSVTSFFAWEASFAPSSADGRTFVMQPGQSYQVADGAEPHRSHTATGAKLFIVD